MMARSSGRPLFPGTRLRRLVFLGLGVTLIAVILAAFWIANGTNGLVKHDVPYVYIKANEVVLIRDGRATARQAGKFGADANLRDNLAWTHNGRYFVILEGNDEYGDTGTRELFVFDTQTDGIRKVRCPDCTSLAPIGDQQLIIGQRAQEALDATVTRTRILRLDLDSTRPPTLIQTNLPKLTSDMRMVTGTKDSVLTAGSNADEISESGGGPEKLFLLNGEGVARPVGETRGNMLIGLTATSIQDGTPKLAIDTGVRSGFCAYADSVSVIDGVTGGLIETANYALVPPDRKAGLDAGFMADDLWWDTDDKLYATFETWDCDDTKPNPRIVKNPPTVWRLDGNDWTKIDTETVLIKRRINEDVQLYLTPSAAAVSSGDYTAGSTLFTKTKGKITPVADKVLFVSVAPTTT